MKLPLHLAGHDETGQFQTLLNLTKPIIGILSASGYEAYADALDVILRVTDSRLGAFGYVRQRNGAWVCPSLTRSVWDECAVSEKDIVFPADLMDRLPTWRQAFSERQSVCVNSPVFVLPDGHVQIERIMIVPVLHDDDELLGMIGVANKEVDYNEDDLGLLEAIADYIAPAMKARLKMDEEEKWRRREAEALRAEREALAQAVRLATASMQGGT